MASETEKTELTSEELDAVSGGGAREDEKNALLAALNEDCPKGGKHGWVTVPGSSNIHICNKCSKIISSDYIYCTINNKE